MSGFDDLLAARGLSRRDFLKGCAALAALLGLGKGAVPDIAKALEAAAAKPPVIWVDWQECLGCTESTIKTRYPDFVSTVLDVINLTYDEAVMAGAGTAATKTLDTVAASQKGKYVLVVEGSVATKIPSAMCVGGKTSVDMAKELIPGAALVIAVGNCAAFGNVQAAYPNPSGAMGMLAFMQQEGMDTAKLIQLPTCPVNPVDLLGTITYFLTYKKVPPLDKWNRPTPFYGQLIHDNCERRAGFDNGRFVTELGSSEISDGRCFYKMGCRGPNTYANCPQALWNNRTSWCIGQGQCIGCSQPGFWDNMSDFYSPIPGVAIPGFGRGIEVSADTIGIGLAALTGVGIVAHFAVTAAKGRLGKTGDDEIVEERAIEAKPVDVTAADGKEES